METTLKEKKFKPIKIGGSYFLHVPYEYIGVFDLISNLYTLEVKNNGDTLVFKKTDDIIPSTADCQTEDDLETKDI